MFGEKFSLALFFSMSKSNLTVLLPFSQIITQIIHTQYASRNFYIYSTKTNQNIIFTCILHVFYKNRKILFTIYNAILEKVVGDFTDLIQIQC